MLKELFMATLKNLLFMMSLSGSVVFLLYNIFHPLAKRYFSLKWKYTILKIAVAFYLIPFSSFKYLMIKGIISLGLWERGKYFQKTETLVPEYMVIFSQNLLQYSLKVKHIAAMMLLMSIIAIVIFLKHSIVYRKMSRLYFANAEDEEDKYREDFLQLKRELKIKKKVKFIRSEHCRTPISGGFFSPMIVFPVEEDEDSEKAYQDILKHELAHIKHHDSVMKFFSVLVVIVHWFNPLSYILCYELSLVSEMYADSVALQGKDDEERCRYGKMILELAARSEDKRENRFFSGAAQKSTKRMYKRRIMEMRANRKSKRVLSILATGVICMASGMTALAYEPLNMVYDRTGYIKSINISIATEDVDGEILPYDYYCVDKNGRIYDLNNIDKDAKAICIHEYIDGVVTEHQDDGKGGCVVRKYKAKICEICAFTQVLELTNTITYSRCPH